MPQTPAPDPEPDDAPPLGMPTPEELYLILDNAADAIHHLHERICLLEEVLAEAGLITKDEPEFAVFEIDPSQIPYLIRMMQDAEHADEN